jgi:hypothetical protein
MLTIRPEQLAVFAEQQYVDDVARWFPEQCAALGPVATRTVIRGGIERAASYGLVDPPEVTIYLRLLFVFGARFDEDERFPWAAEVLRDESIEHPAFRARMLHEAAVAYLREVADE